MCACILYVLFVIFYSLREFGSNLAPFHTLNPFQQIPRCFIRMAYFFVGFFFHCKNMILPSINDFVFVVYFLLFSPRSFFFYFVPKIQCNG